jgi:hypothetical protein
MASSKSFDVRPWQEISPAPIWTMGEGDNQNPQSTMDGHALYNERMAANCRHQNWGQNGRKEKESCKGKGKPERNKSEQPIKLKMLRIYTPNAILQYIPKGYLFLFLFPNLFDSQMGEGYCIVMICEMKSI